LRDRSDRAFEVPGTTQCGCARGWRSAEAAPWLLQCGRSARDRQRLAIGYRPLWPRPWPGAAIPAITPPVLLAVFPRGIAGVQARSGRRSSRKSALCSSAILEQICGSGRPGTPGESPWGARYGYSRQPLCQSVAQGCVRCDIRWHSTRGDTPDRCRAATAQWEDTNDLSSTWSLGDRVADSGAFGYPRRA
jgi:hypothetical protein